MTTDGQAVHRLPSSVSSLLRSSVQLPSIPSIVQHLVHNALDAGAQSVIVTIDLKSCEVRCDDDGCGFDLHVLCDGVQRYSRSAQQQRYGTRGEALASMAAIGLLVIESSGHTLIQRGQEVVHSAPCAHSHMTTVTLKDIYHSLPLRRPSRLDEAAQRKVLDECKRSVGVLALSEPLVRFELRSAHAESEKTLLRYGKVTDLAARFTQVLLPAHSHQCIDVSVSGVQAAIVLAPQPTQSHQYIFINGHVLPSGTPLLEFWPGVGGGDEVQNERQTRRRPLSSRSAAPAGLHRRVADIISRAIGGHAAYVLDLQVSTRGVPDEDDLAKDVCSVIQQALIDRGLQVPRGTNPQRRPVTSTSPHKTSPSHARRPHTATPVPIVYPHSPAPTHRQKYTDPTTNRTYWIDMRTGNSYPYSECAETSVTSAVRSGRRSLASRGRDGEESTAPPWLRDVVSKWENPVLPRQDRVEEPAIPIVSAGSACASTRTAHTLPLPHLQQHSLHFNTSDSAYPLTASSLANARVIAQVSRKFIAAVVDDVVVAIDQHAADERVRFERILEEYMRECTANEAAYELKTPIEIWLSSDEVENASALGWYGFGLALALPSSHSTEVQVRITHVPHVLLDRLRTDATLLTSVIRSFVGTSSHSMPSTLAQLLTQTPPPLLDLLKSKACRGAIMFNDPLSLEQCQRLVGQLSTTHWPFICAHGRPVVVPLCCVEEVQEERYSWSNVRWLGVGREDKEDFERIAREAPAVVGRE